MRIQYRKSLWTLLSHMYLSQFVSCSGTVCGHGRTSLMMIGNTVTKMPPGFHGWEMRFPWQKNRVNIEIIVSFQYISAFFAFLVFFFQFLNLMYLNIDPNFPYWERFSLSVLLNFYSSVATINGFRAYWYMLNVYFMPSKLKFIHCLNILIYRKNFQIIMLQVYCSRGCTP